MPSGHCHGRRPLTNGRGPFADPPPIALVRKLLVTVVVLHVPLALWSGHRAIVQVQRLDLHSPGRVLGEGAVVRVGVVSSGRTTVDVRLEIIQGGHSETLGTRRVTTGRDPAYDPRFRKGTLSVVLMPELLSTFQPGPARLRATARGRPQWLREPPPAVRELAVEIRHHSPRLDDARF